MYTIALFGAGKIGETITGLLTESGRYTVRVCDLDVTRAHKVASMWRNASAHQLNLADAESTRALLGGCQAVLSALPFFCNVAVAEHAAAVGCNYLDLTEDVATTQAVEAVAKKAAVWMMPQCGLAPGFISIAAHHVAKSFDSLESVKMRVGALPVYPSNRLKYNMTWSTEGLINEYGNMCEAIEGGKQVLTFPLEGYERFSLDGVEYEAFNTSGGLGSLVDTLGGRTKELSYKTIRYPGHRDLIQFLMLDLGFTKDRGALKTIFERSIPTTSQDKCIVYVEVQGMRGGRFTQQTYASSIYSSVLGKQPATAIQLTTAAGICAPLDLALTGKLGARRGVIRLEEIPLTSFLDNEFGRWYRDDKALDSSTGKN